MRPEHVETLRRMRKAAAMEQVICPLLTQTEEVEALDAAIALAELSAPQQPDRDACELCLGAKGGAPGNENHLPAGNERGYVVACDYCSALFMRSTPFPAPQPDKAREPAPDRELVIRLNQAFRELLAHGWRDAKYPPGATSFKDGFEVIELGSTGIHKAYRDDVGWWIPDDHDTYPSTPALWRVPPAEPTREAGAADLKPSPFVADLTREHWSCASCGFTRYREAEILCPHCGEELHYHEPLAPPADLAAGDGEE